MEWKVISIQAAPSPQCFDSRLQWLTYLESAQASIKSPNTRPFIDGKFNPNFNHCADCLPATRREKAAQGLCHPPVIAAKKKEPADAA